MSTQNVTPLPQTARPDCSISLDELDLRLDTPSWIRGDLIPESAPNHLSRYYLHIPGVFAHTFPWQPALIFNEPTFRNGVQTSGFLARPLREQVISLIAHRRHAWYTTNHHAVLGLLTSCRHGVPEATFARKYVLLTDHALWPTLFTDLERQVLKFADAFTTNPKSWADDDCESLKAALRADNLQRHRQGGRWIAELNAARATQRRALARGNPHRADPDHRASADATDDDLSADENERIVKAQLLELAFLCARFIALTDVLTGLNIPDEDTWATRMMQVLPPEVITRCNEINQLSDTSMPSLVPPRVTLPLSDIVAGRLEVATAALKGSRVPLVSFELEPTQATRDKGLAVGGAHIDIWASSFGRCYAPTNFTYLLLHHPDLSRYLGAYTASLLYNEDEWHDGMQSGGYVTRLVKNIAMLKVFALTRSRYQLEHHTLLLFDAYLDIHGVGRPPYPHPPLSDREHEAAKRLACARAENAVIFIDQPDDAPAGTFSALDRAVILWVEHMVTDAHRAYTVEPQLRAALDAQNRREVELGVRRLDTAGGIASANSPPISIDLEAAYRRLLDHQIAELAELTGHTDGLARAMTILRCESEEEVHRKTHEDDAVGYLTHRLGYSQACDAIGVTAKARTANELRLNPALLDRLNTGAASSPISAVEAAATGEF